MVPTSRRPAVIATAFLLAGAPAAAQVSVTADAGFFNAYVWRGVSLTNQFVAQPDLYLTVPAGGGSAVLGGWSSMELGRYDGIGDLSEGGGVSSPDLTEIDLWAEYGHPLGSNLAGTAGVLTYLFPNTAGLTNSANRTVEVYGKLQATGVPLAPKLAAWYDVDKVKGAYLEASIAQGLSAIRGFPITFGALAGFSAGQGVNSSDPTQVANFADDGFTHLDLSASGALAAGPVTIAPTVHFYVLNDEFTKITRLGTTRDVKAWAGLSLTWSRPLTNVPTTSE
ncbi:MAG TPA: TorF family putative porin [Gemmatimonadales bacterium]|nr:TorF family putative porin [Gemmatimonadales bacterium]